AIALTADTAFITAWSNDAGYESAFARQIQGLGRPGDLLVAISTSGRSPSVLKALQAARDAGLNTVALLGGDGGEARTLADTAVIVPCGDTQRIQEVQILIIHMICELVESRVVDRVTGEAAATRREASPLPLRAVGPGTTDLTAEEGVEE